MRLIKEIVKELLKIFLGIIWILSFWLGYIFMSIPEVMIICFAINTGCVVILYCGLRKGEHNMQRQEKMDQRGIEHPEGMLTEKDDLGNWCVKGLPWKDLHVGNVITRKMHDKLYACLWKLIEYEDTGLSPEQIELIKDNLTVMANRFHERKN